MSGVQVGLSARFVSWEMCSIVRIGTWFLDRAIGLLEKAVGFKGFLAVG